MTTIRAFCPQIRAFFSIFRKRAGETSPTPSSSYVPTLCQHRSQSKLRSIWNTTTCSILFISCESNISYSLICQKNWTKGAKWLKMLEFQHSSYVSALFPPKLNLRVEQKHWGHKYTAYSHNFYQTQYDLCQDLPKILREQTVMAENTINWPFFILFEHSSIPTKITKQNKNNCACNYMWHSYHFKQL